MCPKCVKIITRFKHKNNYAKTSKDLKNDFATWFFADFYFNISMTLRSTLPYSYLIFSLIILSVNVITRVIDTYPYCAKISARENKIHK